MTAKQTKTASNPTRDEHPASGSFATGFVLGVVTGAIGLWATQNEKGREFLEVIKREWQETLDQELNSPAPSAKASSPAPTAAGSTSGKKFPKFAAKPRSRS